MANTNINVVDNNGNVVRVNPTTTISNVSGLQTALDGKANTGHTHNTFSTSAGFVPAATASDADKFLKGDGTWSTPSGSSAVTGVKGSNESRYRTGNVSLSYSNVGAASSGHTHSTATTSSNGFMSYSDKAKLNSLTPTTLTVSSYGNFTVSSVSSYVCNGFAWLSFQAKSSVQIPAGSSIKVGSMSIAASLSTYMPLNIIVDGAFTRVKGWFDTSNYKDIYINAENAIAANKALYITTCFKC